MHFHCVFRGKRARGGDDTHGGNRQCPSWRQVVSASPVLGGELAGPGNGRPPDEASLDVPGRLHGGNAGELARRTAAFPLVSGGGRYPPSEKYPAGRYPRFNRKIYL